MALSKETVDALKREIKAVTADIERMAGEMKALNDARMAQLRNKMAMEQLINGANSNADQPQQAKTPNSIGGLGLREAIRVTLQKSGHPMMPKEVESALLSSGFREESGAATPLRIRIGNELFKLAKGDNFRRVPQGYTTK